MALRIMMLLSVHGKPVNIDRMISCDFIATYGAYFGIDETNLHGDREYSFGELSVRRAVTFRSIRYLVIQNLIKAVDTENGFFYMITPKGKDIVEKLQSEYAIRYQKVMRKVIWKWGSASDKGLRDIIDVCSRSIQK